MTITISTDHVQETIAHLQVGAQRRCETAVLWLAHYTAPHVVAETYRPEQVVAEDSFHFPPDAVRRMMAHLKAQRMLIAAQVHSHPGRAFHSAADDRWAIVRHEGALSVVVPNFARLVTPKTFLAACAVYQLTADNRWRAVPAPQVHRAIVVN